MLVLGDADLSKPNAPMPAAMLPCPAPAGSDWSFQNPVGVDCSSPEPRCIWLAVLRGTTGPMPPPTPPTMPSAPPRAKGRRDGLSSAGDNPRPPMATRPGREGVSVGWKGPRTLVLRKNSQGFGFTLRHFIVYPPESALHTNLKDEENGNGKGYQKGRMEPMDTIFVKNVREKGPAHQAGLCTGDRLVKVNGESILGKTYSQVIALIQNSESVLELSIMPKDEDVLQLAYSQDAYLTGNEPYAGGAENLPPPPPLCYPRTKTAPLAGAPLSAPMGQNQLDNWSPLSSPLQVHYPNHHGAGSSQAQPRKSSSAWTSPPLPQGGPGRSERCQQALSDWYYSQLPERSGRSMQTRHRSYSQDRLSESRRQQQRSGGWPHSASQDTLLLLQQSGPGPHGEPYWSYGDWEGGPGRATTGLVSPRFERPSWLQQAPQPPPRTDAYPRQGSHFCPQQATPQSRRLPPGQSMDDQPVGYRSYSPSFYRKTGRIMQQAHSFRDPSYSGPHLNWNPEGTSAPVAASTASPLASAAPESQDRAYRPTNHERERGAEVVMRQKPPTGRRNAHGMRHPHYALPMDGLEPSLFSPEPKDSTPGSTGDVAPRKPNGNLAPLPIEDDSLASIPFIDEPTSPGADLRARHVPASSVVSSGMSSAPAVVTSPASPTFTFPLTRLFSHDCSSIKSSRRSSYLLAITTERSKSCDEGLNTFREEGRVLRLPKRVKSFFTDGSLDNLGTAEEVRSKRHSTSELGNITYSDVRREGWLHFKQILTEKGKKVGSGMRPWKRVFSVLRSHSLFLYKDKREAVLRGATIGGSAEDEQPISIRGCLVDIAYSETKRKNALRLTTQDFCEYLLQAEDREDMLDWIKVIRENSKTDSEELGFSRQALINKKLNDYRKQSPTSSKPDSSPRMPRMKPQFLLNKTENAAGSSPPKSPWGINIMKKTKKAGPKAFGVRLEECQPGANNKFIPMIVEICCGLVEEMGLEYTGIYRVPGNNAMVSLLQDQLNKGVDINPAEEKWQDLNVVSSLLKSFFRKLPEPLFTNDKYNDFIDANRMENASDRLKTMKKLIRDLPDHYYHTLKFLVGHLKTVADHSDKNKMEPRNLALVFGPTLVRTSEDNMKDMVTHMPDRYKIVETLIQHTPVDTEDVQPAPNIDHLLSNIGRTALLGEASGELHTQTGSWGSKKDLTAKDFLTLSIMSAVTGRKRRKRHNARRVGSSTDDDSEHEPIKAGHLGAEEEEEEAESPVAPEDARSIVSGYSTLSTLGRSLGSEGRGDDADDEHSELVSETDNESGFASRSLTQERPDKHPTTPTNTQQALPSAEGTGSGSEGAPRPRSSRTNPSSGSSQESLRPARPKPALPPSEAASFTPTGPGGRSLADHVRARLLGSADDLRSVGLRKPLSPETRRKRRAWRRHTVVASPTETSDKRPPLNVNEFPLSPISQNQVKTQGLPRDADALEQGPATRQAPTSRFHQYL
uniref:Rho GTPase activating protein 23a n=1 Tax=Amphiprion ocellaris TaxID=80972 RepID=A0AAQ5YZ55_AMPOC